MDPEDKEYKTFGEYVENVGQVQIHVHVDVRVSKSNSKIEMDIGGIMLDKALSIFFWG